MSMLGVLILITSVFAFLLIYVLYLRNKYQRTSVKEVIHTENRVVINIAVPRQNDKSPLAAEQLFSSIHGIGLGKEKSKNHFSVEIAAGPYGVHFLAVMPREFKSFFENQLYAQYPDAQIMEIGDYAESAMKSPGHIEIAELVLSKDYYLPLRTFTSFDVDPLASVTGAISSLGRNEEVFIQTICRPVSDSWQKAGNAYIDSKKNATDSEGNKTQLETGESEIFKLIENKNSKVGFNFVIRIMAKTPDSSTSQRIINEVLAAYGQYKTAVLNSLTIPKKKKGWDLRKAKINGFFRNIFLGSRLGETLNAFDKHRLRYLDEFTTSIINTEELASLFHLPNKTVETPNISWAKSKKLEFPLNIPTDASRILGVTDYRGINMPFGIMDEDRLRHMYVIGKTGVGKSTFMESMIMADIYEGKGVGVIDPHGETIEHILDMMPPERVDDVVLFDPGDTDFPVALNLLETKEHEDKSLIADGIVSVFHKQFADSWGPRLEYILTNTLITLLHCQNVSLLAVPRILSDDNYRMFLLKQIKDPILLKFWHEEYAALARDVRRRDAEIASILNKIGRFTTNPMMRNIVGQVKSSINIRDVMDQKKVFLVNLAQGKVGEENMALLGGMLITRMYSNVVQRIGTESKEPFYLYVDEFQNFSTNTFGKILSEARKFGLALTIAHQFIDQIDEEIRNAIFGNIGSIINFSVGPRDADFLIKEYTPYIEAEDLVNIGKFRVIIKLSIDLTQSRPFTAKTLRPNFPQTGITESTKMASNMKFGNTKEIVEQKIFKWAYQMYNAEGNLMTPEEMKKFKEAEENRLKKKKDKQMGIRPPRKNQPGDDKPRRDLRFHSDKPKAGNKPTTHNKSSSPSKPNYQKKPVSTSSK